MVKFASMILRTKLDLALVTLLKGIHGLQSAMNRKTYPGIIRTGIKPEAYYHGSVLVRYGVLSGYNGKSIGCAIHHSSNEWMCLVRLYKGSDVYAIPFEYLEKIKIDRIN